VTNEQKNQVAAMNASGMSVEEITIDTGLDRQTVADFVAERDRKNGKGKPLTPETIAQVEDLTRKGWTITDIKAKVGISPASISRIRSGMKTEKEPTPAPTETSSNENIVQVQNTTGSAESQALRGVNVLGLMQTMLEEAYGTDAEIMSLKADSDTASIMFRYGGKAYSVQFGLAF
jgi:uncharacterized protein YerC